MLHDWCNNGRGIYYHAYGFVHITDPLLQIGKSNSWSCDRFPLSLFKWSFTICSTSVCVCVCVKRKNEREREWGGGGGLGGGWLWQATPFVNNLCILKIVFIIRGIISMQCVYTPVHQNVIWRRFLLSSRVCNSFWCLCTYNRAHIESRPDTRYV